MTGRELYLRAADVLEKDGWCQGTYHNDKGQHCAVGALMKVLDEGPWFQAWFQAKWGQAYRRALDAAGFYRNLSTWNDDPGRTKEDVIALFRQCAEIAAV